MFSGYHIHPVPGTIQPPPSKKKRCAVYRNRSHTGIPVPVPTEYKNSRPDHWSWRSSCWSYWWSARWAAVRGRSWSTRCGDCTSGSRKRCAAARLSFRSNASGRCRPHSQGPNWKKQQYRYLYRHYKTSVTYRIIYRYPYSTGTVHTDTGNIISSEFWMFKTKTSLITMYR